MHLPDKRHVKAVEWSDPALADTGKETDSASTQYIVLTRFKNKVKYIDSHKTTTTKTTTTTSNKKKTYIHININQNRPHAHHVKPLESADQALADTIKETDSMSTRYSVQTEFLNTVKRTRKRKEEKRREREREKKKREKKEEIHTTTPSKQKLTLSQNKCRAEIIERLKITLLSNQTNSNVAEH